MSKGTLALIGLAVVGSITALFAMATFDWTAWTCRLPNPTSEPSRPFALGPGGCFEFWLNRYQTLIGVLAATAAAALAWAGVQKQIDVAARQTSVNMVTIINERLVASQKLRTAVAVIDAYDHFSFKALEECVDLIDILRTMAGDQDEAFDLMLKAEMIPSVSEYAACVKKMRENAERVKAEMESAIVVGSTRIEVEEYYTTATMMVGFHDNKLRKLNRFCEVEKNKYIHRQKDVMKFYELISHGGDRVYFQKLPAFESTQLLVDRLTELLEVTIKKAEEGLL